MSAIDSELMMLKQRLEALEEQKRIETQKEAEKKANPMKVLGDIIDEKKKQIERNRYSKNLPLARFYDEEKVAMLEPILNALQDIQKRLTALETK
jgi:DNA-binding HxlR family transcriptional regulator